MCVFIFYNLVIELLLDDKKEETFFYKRKLHVCTTVWLPIQAPKDLKLLIHKQVKYFYIFK